MHIDPVAFTIGPLKIHWYAISYIASILLGFEYCKKLLTERGKNIKPDHVEYFITYFVVGIIIGGRLGHVLFFDYTYYLTYPMEILRIWHGGMSFHGGCIGACLAIYVFCKRYKIDFWSFADVIVCAGPIGIFFGRIANFVNQELYGVPTTSPFGVIFNKRDLFPRHPVQLYEAFTEGFLLFCILTYLYRKKLLTRRLSGVFLAGYSIPRFFLEYLKEPDTAANFQLISYTGLSIGQLISCIFLIFGILIITKVQGE